MKNQPIQKMCKMCQACCCKRGGFIGSPILSFAEAAEIIKRCPESLEVISEVKGPDGDCYYTIKSVAADNHCYFLNEDNMCRINDIKPLDCRSYPIKAVYAYSNIKFVTDRNCPAAGRLHYRFVRQAKDNARRSISRFSQEAYQHWLDNHVGWQQKKYCVK